MFGQTTVKLCIPPKVLFVKLNVIGFSIIFNTNFTKKLSMTKLSKSSTQLGENKNMTAWKPLTKFGSNMEHNFPKQSNCCYKIWKYIEVLPVIINQSPPKECNIDSILKNRYCLLLSSLYLFSKCVGKASRGKPFTMLSICLCCKD